MIQRFLALSTGTIALFSLVVFPAFAATMTTSTAVNAATDVGSTVTGSLSGVGVTVSGTGSNTTTTGSATVTLNGSTNTSGASAMTTGTLNLNDSDAAVMNYNGSSNTAVMTDPTQVSSSADLNTYADAAMHSDSDIQNVQLSNTAVAMTYNEPGKLFGFIPVSISTKAAVDASGNVTVTYPWYHFLISTNDANLKSDLQARIQSTMDNDAAASANASASNSAMASTSNNTVNSTNNSIATNDGFSARMQAEIMADLENGFSSMVNGSATANAQGTSNAAMNASSSGQ